MTFKLFRRGSARYIGLLSAFITIVLFLYYISIGQTGITNSNNEASTSSLKYNGPGQIPHISTYRRGVSRNNILESETSVPFNINTNKQHNYEYNIQQHQNDDEIVSHTLLQMPKSTYVPSVLSQLRDNYKYIDELNTNIDNTPICYNLNERITNITAQEQYAKFDFEPEWIKTKEYWDRSFEERFENQKKDTKRPPLKVIIVPHSHNDPGWLKTFLNYFLNDSRQILNFIVAKMQEFTDMTFIWSEISFLQLWWDQAHPTKQRALKHLINSGRFEITTGGWVMTDEANVHIYAMLDQLIEGHQWLKNNLNITPKIGWSIDPFGHGSTIPYLLSGSNFEGTIIQRIHYAWKQWFAKEMKGDFIWTPYWQKKDTNAGNLLVHNMPFDIYSIKGSCGPHPFICLNFDFRKIPGEYTEYSIRAQFINDDNVQEKAKLLLEQYARTASLFPHNIALIPVGDDFRYNKEREVIQQYTNYKKLIDHIIKNKHLYNNVDINFGTPKDYFREIRKRSNEFPTFKGDFYVYADIFSEGRPAYWSGYYTTRPFYKILSNDLEHNLRSTEILFTLAYNTARQYHNEIAIKIFEKNYEKIICARRNLGLFQHHDAITGTSKTAVMRDYGIRLFKSIQDLVKMQELTIEIFIQNDTNYQYNFLSNDLERDSFSILPRKTVLPLTITSQSGKLSIDIMDEVNQDNNDTYNEINSATFVVFNPLSQRRIDVIIIRTMTCKIKLIDEHGVEMRNVQINPVWNNSDLYEMDLDPSMKNLGMGRLRPSKHIYEVLFFVDLDPLSITTYHVVIDEINYKKLISTIYCDHCINLINNSTIQTEDFIIKAKPIGDIQLENNRMNLLFDEKTGFLTTITRKQQNNNSNKLYDQRLLKPMKCAIKFAAYRSAQFHSGAYLFKTDSEKIDAEKNVLDQYDDINIIIISGNIASDVTVQYGSFLTHTVRLYNTDKIIDAGIFIENDIDFEMPPKNRETEFFMRFVTDINNIINNINHTSKDDKLIPELPILYTDQNGFQYHKRVKVPSIGIEGNYFPITTTAFIQDDKIRLTLLTTHAQGASSYKPGQLEIMLDRRTLYDDYRGMGEGVLDSTLTRHKFWIIIEDILYNKISYNHKYQVPSLFANYLSNSLRYPLNLYFVENFDNNLPKLKNKINLFTSLNDNESWPCDIHLLNLRTLSEEKLEMFPTSSSLMILHRQGFDCSVGKQLLSELFNICSINPTNSLGEITFEKLQINRLETTSLTGTLSTNKRKRLKSFQDISLQPMDILTLNITFNTK